MTLDATIPDGSEMGSELPALIRENRVQINANEVAVGILSAIPNYIAFDMAATGDIDTDGTDLQDVYFEVIYISASTASIDIQSIINGRAGMVKIFVVEEDVNTVTFKHDSGVGAGIGAKGDLFLNGETDLDLVEHDVVAFINLAGDAGTLEDGTWREIFRTLWYD